MLQIKSPRFLRLARQKGQALIYGLFVLTGGVVALFFLFNTGQLSSEKTKLVNTADAVAYSAGVMHARALNFDAYTNRAMMANEAMIAQMVSVSSWVQYAQGHVDDVPPLNCYTIYSVPVGLVLRKYAPLCYALSWVYGALAVQYAKEAVDIVAPIAVAASELAKMNLQLAQTTMYASFLPARKSLMQEVADANYLNDGIVKVDTIPLTDNYSLFDGKPFITPYTGNERARFRDTELAAAYSDDFVKNRSWSDKSPWPCSVPTGYVNRTGSTTLIGFDEWQASDAASFQQKSWHFHWYGVRCGTDFQRSLGDGNQSAKKDSSSSDDWSYNGVPSFYDLSDKALAYAPDNPAKDKQDPRLRFAVRLTRANTEAKTSTGRSAIKPSGQMDIYQGKEAAGVMAAVATSEVYFERPVARADGLKELASLFNPYWQVHLIANSAADVAMAMARQ